MKIKGAIPELRFAGFNDYWKFCRLGDLSESFEYGLNAPATEYDGKNKYLRITDIDENTRLFIQDNITSPRCNYNVVNNYKLKYGDVVFARTGASVGKSYIYSVADGLVYYAGYLIRARIKEENNPEFVFYNTLTNSYKKYITVTSQRSGQPGVNAEEYSKYSLHSPGYDEQALIALLFKTLEESIIMCKNKLIILEKVKQGMLSKMFPKKSSEVPRTRFGEFADTWEKMNISDIASRYDNLRVPIRASDRVSGKTPYYGANGIQDYVKGYTHSGEFVLIAEDGANDIRNYPVQCVEGDIWVNNHAHVLQGIGDLCNNQFLSSALRSTNFTPYLVGGGRAKLNSEVLMKLEIKMPSLYEQEKIGVYFKKLDRIIELQEREIELLEETKKGFLQKMFV